MYFYDCLNDIKHFLAYNFQEFREKMEYKKTIILLALVVFLLSIAGVSASEIDNTIASENANTIELSTDNDIEDNLQTSEENEALASTDYDEAIAQTDTEVLGADSAKYSDLANEINQSGNIKLTHKYYTYDEGATAIIILEANKVIDGNGAVIDMAGSTIRAFHVNASGVTIKNLTIKNANYNGEGGAIFFYSTGTVTNCNFADNTAGDWGGAVYFDDSSTGSVTNCNFTGNTATGYGGAIRMYSGSVEKCNFVNNSATGEGGCGGAISMYSGTVSNCNFADNKATGEGGCGGAVFFYTNGEVTNCNFTDNKATRNGGAVFFLGQGTVTNCNFADNTAYRGGAIFSMQGYTTADTCIFKRNSNDNVNTVIYPPTLNVNNFTTVHGSGEKLTFDLKTNSSIPVTNGNISISVYFKDNGEWVRNYTCLSGEGWIPDLPVGSYIAVFNTTYAEFQPINRTVTITVPEHTFWFLNYTINGNDNPVIELSHDFYFDPAYDAAFVNGIVINRPVTIKGNGNAIDAKRQARIFYVQSANTVIENITFKNACTNDKGGAIYISDGSIINCNFVNNTAEYGGAVYFSKNGNVTCCNFTDNKATGNDNYCNGGAVYMRSGSIESCNFDNNIASATNRASSSGGAVYFPINGNVTNCNFTNNKATGSDGWGGAIYISLGNIENCHFTDNYASADGGAIFFLNNGTLRNCNFTGNKASDNGGAIFFHIETADSIMNCNFTNNKADNGGAIYFNFYIVASLENCNFTNNHAIYNGGAIYFDEDSNGSVMTCNFVGNHASYKGGAICLGNESNVTNCNFTSNYATSGSAIYFENTSATKTLSNSLFLNNRANVDKTPLNITLNGNDVEIVFMGRNNLLNAIYSDCNVNLVNVTYWGANGISNITDAAPIRSNREAGINITVIGVVNGNVVNTTILTDSDGKIVLNDVCDYWIIVSHEEDSYYTKAAETLFTNMNLNANLTSQTTTNKNLNITAKSNIYNEVMPGQLIFILPNGEEINATYGSNGIWWADYTFPDYGNYDVKAKYIGLDNVTVRNATITVNKIKTVITGNAVTTTYNINKNLVITLKDSEGNILSGVNVIVDLNGAKTYTTDKNGQVKVSTKGLAPKAYTAKVTFNGNTNYDKSTKDVKVTVKKATPKLTAKKKTFKTSVKTKKYTITLKDNTGKAIKKAKVILKVKGKTYKATTNSKGKAVFKIKNLKKKGTFKATITYKGNKYYNKVSKKANIKVIVTFKTVSKGSKDKSTVKEIQQALKDHGYYLSYKGHYLKVDGKFKGCTERSVKEFQKDKGLKVTGKVDEKTAKKLGLI